MDSNNEAAKSATNDNQIVLSQIAIDYLLKATNWAKFLSILGFIAAAFLASTAMFMGATVANMSSIGVDNSLLMLIGSSIPIIYFICAFAVFILHLFLYQFANNMKQVILNREDDLMDSGMLKLHSYFKMMSIIMILYLAFAFIGAGFMLFKLIANSIY